MRYWVIRTVLFEAPFAALFIISIMSGLYSAHAGDGLAVAFWATVCVLMVTFHDRAQAQVLRLTGGHS